MLLNDVATFLNLLVDSYHSMWKEKYEGNVARLTAMQRPKKIDEFDTIFWCDIKMK